MAESSFKGKRLLLGLQIASSIVMVACGLFVVPPFEDMFGEAGISDNLPTLTAFFLEVYIFHLLVVPSLFIVGGFIIAQKLDTERANPP